MDEKVLEIEELEVQVEGAKSTIKIASDVVATIAGIAAADIEGVASMSGGVVSGLSQILGKKTLTKGVKVEIDEDTAVIDISIIVYYGAKIPEVAGNIQTAVTEAVSNMTGLAVGAVDVHVLDVQFQEPKVEEAVVETEAPSAE